MKPSVTPFTAIYSQWLESFKAIFPGAGLSGNPEEKLPTAAQVAAVQEWEDEGGSLKPAEAKEAGKTGTIPGASDKVRGS